MPYIITTTPDPIYAGRAQSFDAFPTRTAVATLDEAREIMDPLDVRPAETAIALTNDGTVGPLPDGTVIEVRQASWFELRRMTGRAPGESLGADAQETRANVLAAFNGSQS